MPSSKTAAVVASATKTRFINVPRIVDSCDYRNFLDSLLREKHNRKLFLRSEKEAVDQCFRLQATEQFKFDNASLKIAMAKVKNDRRTISSR